VVQSQPRQIVHETLSRKKPFTKEKKGGWRAGGVDQGKKKKNPKYFTNYQFGLKVEKPSEAFQTE
jgi:hypothetical protein